MINVKFDIVDLMQQPNNNPIGWIIEVKLSGAWYFNLSIPEPRPIKTWPKIRTSTLFTQFVFKHIDPIKFINIGYIGFKTSMVELCKSRVDPRYGKINNWIEKEGLEAKLLFWLFPSRKKRKPYEAVRAGSICGVDKGFNFIQIVDDESGIKRGNS